jgi:hypothetical protein
LNLLAVARIALVKPDKARNVENMILGAAQRRALQSKVRCVRSFVLRGRRSALRAAWGPLSPLPVAACTRHCVSLTCALPAPQVSEEQLKGMLEQISEREAKATKITIQRRRPTFDDEDL